MPNLNKVMVMGNLTRDPEVRYTPKGTAVADLGLAINRTYKDGNDQKQEDTTFLDVTFWGKSAEIIGQYMKKGRPIYIEGRLQLDTWEDKNSGQSRSKLKVIGEQFQFLGGGDASEHRPNQAAERQTQNRDPRPGQNPPPEDETDIPF